MANHTIREAEASLLPRITPDPVVWELRRAARLQREKHQTSQLISDTEATELESVEISTMDMEFAVTVASGGENRA